MPAEIKIVGNSGQISLGKQHAGKTVMVEELEPGVWMIRTARVVPDNEEWLHHPSVRASLDRALAISQENARSESDMESLARKVRRSK